MVTTVNLNELQSLISFNHTNPHGILGMHEISFKGKQMLAVRVFIPQAKNVFVYDPEKTKTKYIMQKIHDDGFFEALIEERHEWFMYKLNIEDYNGNIWDAYDSYSFLPVLTDLDLHLFGEGTHYEIYDKLGAHLKTINGISGVLFAVWAPNAKSVSVVGDFNTWDPRRNMMRRIKDSGIFELFIPGIMEHDIYKYEIHTHSGESLIKSDPYGNYAEIRPKTASIVYNIDSYTWNDKEYMAKRKRTDPTKKGINIYEVHLGSWRYKEDGTILSYREIAKELVAYVKEMGYTHIELLPVMEHPYDGSWGYQVIGYYAPTSRYGTPSEFMYFVDYCHQNDIGVILDWVPAHFPKDSHGLRLFDGTALYEHMNPKKGEHPEWGTLVYNFGRKEVKNFLIANALFWLEKYHVDGLRVDAVASMIYLDYAKNYGEWEPNIYGGRENIEAVEFIKHMNDIALKRNKGVMMIAEESTSWANVSRPCKDGGLGFNFKWNMGWMNDFLRYIKQDPVYRKYYHNDITFGLIYAYTENFIQVLSHDEVVHGKLSLLNKMPGDLWKKFANLRASIGFMMTHPGKKLLFMGGEFGQFIEWDEKRQLDWFLLEYEHHKKAQQFVKAINKIYKEERALWLYDYDSKGFEWIDCTDYNLSVISYIRLGTKREETLLCVLNFTPETYFKHRVGVPYEGTYKEILNSDHEDYFGSGVINKRAVKSEKKEYNGRENSIEIKVAPLSITIFKYKKTVVAKQKITENSKTNTKAKTAKKQDL